MQGEFGEKGGKMETIQKYNPSVKSFEQSANYKVKKLLEMGLVSKVTDGVYSVLPIPGYNITTYTIKEHFGQLICNCQMGRKGRECSHVRAVRIYQEQTEHIKEQQLHML